jgi:DNA (cytosine-5)-methyltransferase 1
MSYGFHLQAGFGIAAAVDAQIGKPSSRPGSLGCNASYQANLGLAPLSADLAGTDPRQVCAALGVQAGQLAVLTACPPCTGFTRTLARNHLSDDTRNGLVARVAAYARVLEPEIVLVENARELVMGRFAGHLAQLRASLEQSGYQVSAGTHFFSEFGLPQRRERALVIAVRRPLRASSMDDLWQGWRVDPKATHVRRAIWHLPPMAAGGGVAGPGTCASATGDNGDPMHIAPGIRSAANRQRLAATPADGGGWTDLIGHPEAASLLTPSMRYRAAAGKLGSHPDVYGRLWWDRPAVTIKRECGHIGNGRYAHPEQDRLCTVREMAILQGFPRDYTFAGSMANMYRHIGDAVPPLISYQLAALCRWILTGLRPEPDELIMPGCQLSTADLARADA